MVVPRYSSAPCDFNIDFGMSFTPEQQQQGGTYNFAHQDQPPDDAPGISAFALQDGDVFHTYSSYSRGLDPIMSRTSSSTSHPTAATKAASSGRWRGCAATTLTTDRWLPTMPRWLRLPRPSRLRVASPIRTQRKAMSPLRWWCFCLGPPTRGDRMSRCSRTSQGRFEPSRYRSEATATRTSRWTAIEWRTSPTTSCPFSTALASNVRCWSDTRALARSPGRRVAIDNLERVAGLVLEASPTALCGDAGLERFVESVVSGLEDPIADFARSFLGDMSSDELATDLLDELVGELLKVPARVWKEMFAALLTYDDVDELGRITAPTLLVWGDADGLVGRHVQETLADRIGGSELLVYPGAGHTPRWDDPTRFAATIASFVERSPTSFT
jgi:Bacterial protein of unknown function (DUF899)/Alpha/beta hydrolase family